MKKTIYTFALFFFMPYFMMAQAGNSVQYASSNPNRDPSPGNNGATVTLNYHATSGGRHSYRYIFQNSPLTYVEVIYRNSRWEIHGFETGGSPEDLLFYTSAVQSSPNPPDRTFGNWSNEMTNFSGTGTQSVMPVELIAFEAQATEGGKTHLTWATASETNNKHFDIERSTNGKTFHSIGQVKGNNKPSTYQFVDHQPFATTYYRLRQLDFDGTETLSKIVSVVQTGKGKGFKVYPNPVSSHLTIEVIARNEATEGADFQIINLLGQQVLNGQATQRIDVSALPQGTYILKVGAEQAKFLKQ
jgi:hypothetical protein